jgi:hypothetical protein
MSTNETARTLVDKFRMDTKDSYYTVIEGDDADQLIIDIDAALREAKAQTFDDVREAQAVWQDDRGEFYRLYRCDTFNEWCLSEQRKLLEDKP